MPLYNFKQNSGKKGKIRMKTILCYGDSNTWGADPVKGVRFGIDERWPGVLRNQLGEGFHVIEEGLCGRTTVWNDPIEGYKSGKEYLIPCLDTHSPVDIVIIMLGTNDLKRRFSLASVDIANGAAVLVDIVKRSCAGPNRTAPKVLLLAPPQIMEMSYFSEMFEGGAEKSLKFGEYYKRVAEERGCEFMNTAEIIKSSRTDGIHFEITEHKKLGKTVAEKIKQML
jgi:lysophospholipase L1-like esterase